MKVAMTRIGKAVGLWTLACTLLAAVPAATLGAPPDGPRGPAMAAKPGKAAPAAVELLARAKLGSYIEDLTYIGNGPHAHHVAFVDGWEVRAFPATTRSDRAIRKLFDLRALAFATVPRGIEWIESEQVFVFTDVAQPDVLLVTDAQGRPLPPRALRYLDGYAPEWIDGVGYIPPGASEFPDHLVIVANGFDEDAGDYRPRYVIVRRDGQAVAEIRLVAEQWPYEYPPPFAMGVAWVAPGRLLIGVDSYLATVDFAGNLTAPLVDIPGVGDGLAALPDGRIVESDGAKLHFRDAHLGLLPGDERNAGTGAGLVYPGQLFWDGALERFEIAAYTEASAGDSRELGIFALPPRFDVAVPLVDLGVDPALARFRGWTAVPNEARRAVLLRRAFGNPAEIAFYDGAGNITERVSLAGALGTRQPNGVGYMEDRGQFSVGLGSLPTTHRVVDRYGSTVRDIDFGATGVSVAWVFAYLPPSAGRTARFVVADLFGTKTVLTDDAGNALAEFDHRDLLGVGEAGGVAPITSGRWAGAFAMTDTQAHEIVVFRWRGVTP